MKRGEIWTIAGGADYAGKPRPAIVIQSDSFDITTSVTVCPLTGDIIDNVYARFIVQPSVQNGLQTISHVMVDKILTLPKFKIGRRVGRLEPTDLARLNRHIALFLGLADRRE